MRLYFVEAASIIREYPTLVGDCLEIGPYFVEDALIIEGPPTNEQIDGMA